MCCVSTAPAADFVPACDAFGHWCYHETEGRAMVVDVQGWYDEKEKKAILTDPCVHCTMVGIMDHEDRTLVSDYPIFAGQQCIWIEIGHLSL